MSDAPAIVHTMPSGFTSLQIGAGLSMLLATAALAFVAGAATATAILGHSTDATQPSTTIPQALTSAGSDPGARHQRAAGQHSVAWQGPGG